MAAEYIAAGGNHRIMLCERGIRTFETAYRNVLDVTAVAVLKRETHLPVIVDPSHAGGKAWMVPALSCAAVAAGADGLLIEVHPCPAEAWCDADQALSIPEFANLMQRSARSRGDGAFARIAAAGATRARTRRVKLRALPGDRRDDMELAKSFEPHAIEAKWYPLWEVARLFQAELRRGAPPYCIQLPPPNVTGTLHMGHAFQQTLMDVLIRYHRMRGYNTLWQVGTDHAGIATQIVVEQQLKAAGTDAARPRPRDVRRARVGSGRRNRARRSRNQMRRLGASADWSRERFTMDEGCRPRCSRRSSACTRTASSTAASASSTGIRSSAPRCPISRSRARRSRASIWQIRYPLADGSGLARRRDDAARDDAGRRRGRRESGRRALPRVRRQARHAAAHRPHDPGHRRRLRRPRVRHRRA